MNSKTDYVLLINEHLDDLLVDGWQHGRTPVGLLQAIAYVPVERLDGRPSGKPSSRTPLTRQDTLRMDAQSIIRRAHHKAMTELHGPDYTYRALNQAEHLRELLPELPRATQRIIERSLKTLVHRILISLKEKRPDVRIRAKDVFCPDHFEEGTKPPLYMRPFEEGSDDLATAVCHVCNRQWGYEELLWLGQLIGSNSLAVSA